MNCLRRCRRYCTVSEDSIVENETNIEKSKSKLKNEAPTEIKSSVYERPPVEEKISNPSITNSSNPTGTIETKNPYYVKSAADIL